MSAPRRVRREYVLWALATQYGGLSLDRYKPWLFEDEYDAVIGSTDTERPVRVRVTVEEILEGSTDAEAER